MYLLPCTSVALHRTHQPSSSSLLQPRSNHTTTPGRPLCPCVSVSAYLQCETSFMLIPASFFIVYVCRKPIGKCVLHLSAWSLDSLLAPVSMWLTPERRPRPPKVGPEDKSKTVLRTKNTLSMHYELVFGGSGKSSPTHIQQLWKHFDCLF